MQLQVTGRPGITVPGRPGGENGGVIQVSTGRFEE